MRRASTKFDKSGGSHEAGRDTTLAAVLLQDGIFERVEEWTSLDEILESEDFMVEPEEAEVVLVPIEDYEKMCAATERTLLRLDRKSHQHAKRGWTLLKPGELKSIISRSRHDTLVAMLRYIWFDCRNLWDAMRALLAITHKWRPDFVKGMSGAEIARLLGFTRQAFNRQSLKLVEDHLQRWGVSPMQTPGSKGVLHQQKKREQMQGRRHRAEDYEPEAPEIPMKPITKRQLAEMAKQAERKRLAKLAGVQPEDINLDKINLKKTNNYDCN